jgi:hypothetical protein
MIDPKHLAALVKAFRDLHSCQAIHVETVPVIERWQDKTVWEGEVEVFELNGHPKAARGYAWAYDKAQGSEILAVLELPPVTSAVTAVQAAIAREVRVAAILAEARAEASANPSDDGDWYFARPNKEGVWCDGDGDPLP